jgi:hypothetical protein
VKVRALAYLSKAGSTYFSQYLASLDLLALLHPG